MRGIIFFVGWLITCIGAFVLGGYAALMLAIGGVILVVVIAVDVTDAFEKAMRNVLSGPTAPDDIVDRKERRVMSAAEAKDRGI